MIVKWKAAVFASILAGVVVYLFIEVGTESEFVAFTLQDSPPMAKPNFWPRVMLVGLLTTSLLKLFLTARKSDDQPSKISLTQFIFVPKVMISVCIITLYCYLSQYLGFAFATIVFTAVYMGFMGMTKLKFLIAIPIISTLSILLVFWRFLYVAVPKGEGIFLKFSNLIMDIIRFGIK